MKVLSKVGHYLAFSEKKHLLAVLVVGAMGSAAPNHPLGTVRQCRQIIALKSVRDCAEK